MPRLNPQLSARAGRGCLIPFALIWNGFCIFWMLAAISSGKPVMMLCGIPHTAVGIGLIAWIVWPAVIGMKVGPAEVEVSETRLSPGGGFTFRFRQPVRKELAVDSIAVRLIFRESATYSQGTSSTTVTHNEVLAEHRHSAARFAPSQTLSLEHAFEIPADAMHTFSSAHNKLQWLVEVHVAIVGWPDFKEEYELNVAPALRGGGHGAR